MEETVTRRPSRDLYLVKSLVHAAEVLSTFQHPGEALLGVESSAHF